MTDEEIVEVLKRADALLVAYGELLHPILNELADRKSLHVFGEPGHYDGKLGCWEEGPNKVCLHLKDGERPDVKDGEWSAEASDAHYEKVFAFEEVWRGKVNLKMVYIGGHS